MDKNDILDYVTETPGNTNRAVLRSMLDSVGSGGNLPEVTEDDNGMVLTVVEGVWDKAEGGGSGGGALMVNIVVEPVQGGAILVRSMDKTIDEITEALDAGINVVARAGVLYEGVIADYLFMYPMEYTPAIEEYPSMVIFASTKYEKGNPNYITSYRLQLSSQAGIDPVFSSNQGSF